MTASVEHGDAAKSADLLAAIRRSEMQVERLRAAYDVVVSRDAMSWWLAEAASELRKSKGRLAVHIAAELSMSESSVSRFERHITGARDPDAFVAAYARDLDTRPIEIWRRALELWAGDEKKAGEDDAGKGSPTKRPGPEGAAGQVASVGQTVREVEEGEAGIAGRLLRAAGLPPPEADDEPESPAAGQLPPSA